MKAFYKSIMLIAAAAMTFVSCQKEIENQEIDNGPKMKTIKVSTDIATRTTLDENHENLVWSSGDKISIFNNANNTNSELAYTAGGDIELEVPATTTEIYAHYPYYSGNISGPGAASVYIPNNQTQTNPGELNGHNFPMVAKGTVSADNKALISFYPVASALALNIYHTGLDGEESVKSVKVTPSSSNTKFTGSQSTDLTGDNIKYTEAASSDPITLTLTNALALSSTKPADKQTFAGQIYVCLAKQSYANVKFEIETTKGTYTITSNDTPFDCVSNDFVPVNINLAKAEFDGPEPIDPVNPTDFSWTLVKDALAVGDKVVIAAAESNVAMSTTQNKNNRDEIAIAKSSDFLTANANVQVFEVVAGSKSNTFALKCLNGDEIRNFITSASSDNNYLHSTNSIDDNASWTINIESNGVAGVVSQGSYTRNTIRYNSGSSMFSCYSTGQADIVFYRAGLPSANLSFPEASCTVNLGDPFTAPTLTNPYSVSVTYSSSNSNIASVDASTGAVTIKAAGQATITAYFDGNDTYNEGSASYTISVIDPDLHDLTWDLTTASYSSASPEQVTWQNANVTMVADKADASTAANNYLPTAQKSTRFYTNSSLTFTPAAGVTITKIEYTATTANYATALSSSAWTNATASVSNTVVTIVPANGNDPIIATIGGTTGASAIKVYYTGGSTVVVTEYTITIASNIVNGTVTASATKATQGTEITLTATPANNYQLEAFAVIDANNNVVNVADNSFTMPASDVTVSATFKEKEAGTYTLTPANGTNNSYGGNCDVTINDITWNVTGNAQMVPWRIGGKSLNNVDREVYSKTAIGFNVDKIEITHGAASSITVNSMTVIVSKNEDFSNPVSTLTPSFVANGKVTINKPADADWSECYFKIVYNVSVTGNSNRFLEFSGAVFTGQ